MSQSLRVLAGRLGWYVHLIRGAVFVSVRIFMRALFWFSLRCFPCWCFFPLFRACELHTPALVEDVGFVFFLVIPNCSVTAWSGVVNGL